MILGFIVMILMWKMKIYQFQKNPWKFHAKWV